MKHLYKTVAEDIAARIGQGVYRPGERRLSRQLNVSVSTALEAYRLLEDQGRIQARLRSGYYVSHFRRLAINEPKISAPPMAPSRVTGQFLTRRILLAAKDPYQINLGSSGAASRFSAGAPFAAGRSHGDAELRQTGRPGMPSV
jgi:DNA-binding transcriptional MocR family regulator